MTALGARRRGAEEVSSARAPRARAWGALAATLGLCLATGCAPVPRPPDPRLDQLDLLERDLPSGDDYGQRWRLASACLALVDRPSTLNEDRLALARRGLGHAQRAVELEPGRVEGLYFRAIGLGLALEHTTLPRLSRIEELEQAARTARAVDPSYGCAGSLRLLALLYTEAPPWPMGPELAGDTETIESLWREAIRLAPDCPENHQYYAEFLSEQGRDDEALAEAQIARRLLQGELPAGELEPWEREALEERVTKLLAAHSG